MNTAMSKTNFINCEANLYSWQLNTLQTPYQQYNSSSLCCYRRYQLIQNFILG
ncbi:hypothetical protein H1P_110060 [Hyella patelloides LEGE 07179]|uniref:Uncharacterized protein n=1 Tax=Hyella patelloides LEGE 07179 TaxID=945734 RepID=A0A563VJH7_9CYAN|nr:hypothetical protein H1P_110060 [Hyella patelloides LEGE 07179]